MIIDVRSKESVYITINEVTYYIDDSTDEQIVHVIKGVNLINYVPDTYAEGGEVKRGEMEEWFYEHDNEWQNDLEIDHQQEDTDLDLIEWAYYRYHKKGGSMARGGVIKGKRMIKLYADAYNNGNRYETNRWWENDEETKEVVSEALSKRNEDLKNGTFSFMNNLPKKIEYAKGGSMASGGELYEKSTQKKYLEKYAKNGNLIRTAEQFDSGNWVVSEYPPSKTNLQGEYTNEEFKEIRNYFYAKGGSMASGGEIKKGDTVKYKGKKAEYTATVLSVEGDENMRSAKIKWNDNGKTESAYLTDLSKVDGSTYAEGGEKQSTTKN